MEDRGIMESNGDWTVGMTKRRDRHLRLGRLGVAAYIHNMPLHGFCCRVIDQIVVFAWNNFWTYINSHSLPARVLTNGMSK